MVACATIMFAASAIIRKVLITTALTTQVEPNNRDSGLQKYSHAKRYKAAQIVTSTRPSAQTFYTLAVFAYAAGDKRTGDLAAAKTLSLTPTGRKTQTKLLLDQAKKPQTGAQGGAQAPAQSATGQ